LGQFDIVVANILAGPITDLGPTFCSVICPGGDMVLSGILDRQAQQVMDAYPQVAFDPMTLEDEWVCLTGRLTE
jgi:ribosomal protein L11 methyltransferase